MRSKLVVYVDVDDTLVQWAGSKAIPRTMVIEHVRALHAAGATLYCWSTGGGEYSREVARDLEIEGLFEAFLPKPEVMLDDQPPTDWRALRVVYPMNVRVTEDPVSEYRAELDGS